MERFYIGLDADPEHMIGRRFKGAIILKSNWLGQMLEMMRGPLEGIQYCTRCCMPETQEGVTFDEFGVCMACQSSEHKIRIDWAKRRQELEKILEQARNESSGAYDCIVPISGGKDSVFQLHVLRRIYDMRVLTVTFSHNWYSEIGWYNLQNALHEFNCDNIMFTPNRSLVNRLAKRSLSQIGDACWHCHAGVGSFPLQVAVKFDIPLLIWGESTNETSGRGSHECPMHTYDREYFQKVSSKKKPEEMVSGEISKEELSIFTLPTEEEIDRVGVKGIHLGDYMFWDEERQTEFITSEYGWKQERVEGAYKQYKSVECIMPGVHDLACFLKRGYGRATFQACLDVRNGLMTREEGFELATKIERERPGALDYYLKITGYTESEFKQILQSLKHSSLGEIDIRYNNSEESPKGIEPYVEAFIRKHKRGDA